MTAADREFRLVRPLGQGSTSRVFLTVDAQGGRAALKVAHSADQRDLLAAEARRLLHVDSRSLTGLIDAGLLEAELSSPDGAVRVSSGLPYVLLEWAEGSATDVRAERSEPERTRRALIVARDVGEALSDLHAMGSAHGDVKPENIVIDAASSRARLVDLGLGADSEASTPSGGTPRYLPPEVLTAGVAGTGRARDLWALGLVLAEIANAQVARSKRPAEVVQRTAFDVAIEPIVRALLAEAPAARPSADWVRRRALAALGREDDPSVRAERSRRAVQRSYLAIRRTEIDRASGANEARIRVAGEPGSWLSDAIARARRVRLLEGSESSERSVEIREISALDRSRWLVALVGAMAASWPALDVDDAELARRLLSVAERREPRAFTLADVTDVVETVPERKAESPIGIALALGAGATDAATLDAAEQWVNSGDAAPDFVLALGRALRLKGEIGRALSVLGRLASAAAQMEAGECARRAGDVRRCRELLDSVKEDAMDAATAARRRATFARLELDAGNAKAAHEALDGAPESASVLEVRALSEIALGLPGVERTLERARLAAAGDEEHARIEAVGGMFAHHVTGDALAALAAFRAAAQHAARAHAVLEEATYLTGLAAAASNLGELSEALDASRRAALLFESLGRNHEAARAFLVRASVFAWSGAVDETRDAVLITLERARAAADARCEGYAHLPLADVLPDRDEQGLVHARRAAELLADGAAEDRLHAMARLLRRGDAVDISALDALGRSPRVPIDARLEWWRARACIEASKASPERPESIVAELCALAQVRAPTAVLGPALAAGADLAARSGDGDSARRLALAAGEAARELVRRAPAELRTAIAGLAWVTALRAPSESSISPEQTADIEALVRSLGTRDRLRPLLDQVLDALVLWTGVERGLLLLRAPGGKLVPRAARNLARADLSGDQLMLSRSLAERALAQREPVVAVDAAGELPEMHRSVHSLKLRSVLAVPLLARGEALGVVYLDDRVRRGAFGSRELAWVRLVGALAAVAIADARDQILLRRSVRRALRAEQRLASELARREAELDVAERELARARDARDTRFSYDDIVGRSEPIRTMLRVIDKVTASEVPVLITGESGSGKELVARAIHRNGARSKAPFVTENCGAIPEGLLESTLFGHVRGAFTGASRPRAGLFEIADRGTLFLDEIAEMSLGMQTKLLRVLEGGEVRPVGSERARRVDVRVIAATHRDLEERVKAGSFRQDLFYRLNVIGVRVPSLRERPSDIPLLARRFIALHAPERNVRLSKVALDALSDYDWPGNVRQLENEMRRALVLADDVIDLDQLSLELRERRLGDADRRNELNIRQRVDTLETELVRTALERTEGNQTRAAELLGLSRFGLQKMMRRLQLSSRPSASRPEGARPQTGPSASRPERARPPMEPSPRGNVVELRGRR